jgi:DNA polymerase-3 subunit epsilon
MKERWLTLRRWNARRRGVQEPLAAFLSGPVPSLRTTFRDAEFVSLDIETTGLDANADEMLSVGWVVIRDGKVDLSTAHSFLVRPSGEVGSSASIHGLTDTVVGEGHDSEIILDKIVEELGGRALLVHHAGLDKLLLDRMCRQRYGAPLLVPCVDTLALELRRQKRKHHIGEQGSLRLGDLRTAYQLPRYNAHDCLVDAIATAELLIAMVAHNGGATGTRLRDLIV